METTTTSSLDSPPLQANNDTTTTTQQQQQLQQQSPPTRGADVGIMELPLDWTQLRAAAVVVDENGVVASCGQSPPPPPYAAIRYPWDVVDDIDMEDTELVIVGTAGQKITRIGTDLPQRCNAAHLRTLVLRSHLIKTMDPCLHQFPELQTLELYDNMIEELKYLGPATVTLDGDAATAATAAESINSNDNDDDKKEKNDIAVPSDHPPSSLSFGPPGFSLKVLDMSYNAIRDMAPVAFCPNLVELYLANNKLKTMAGLQGLSQLRKLDLGANKLREMDVRELSGLVSLEELWLGKNKIEHIQGLATLQRLRRLDVQSNRLTHVDQLEYVVETLEELYLAHNGLTDQGITNFTHWTFQQLTTLDLSRNQLTTTVSLSHIGTLEELWLSSNQITDIERGVLEPLSSSLVNLETIYLEYNPIAQEFEYRKKLKEGLPSLQQIDATPIVSVHVPTTSSLSTTSGIGQQPRGVLLPATARELQSQVIQRARLEMLEQQKQQQSKNKGTDES